MRVTGDVTSAGRPSARDRLPDGDLLVRRRHELGSGNAPPERIPTRVEMRPGQALRHRRLP